MCRLPPTWPAEPQGRCTRIRRAATWTALAGRPSWLRRLLVSGRLLVRLVVGWPHLLVSPMPLYPTTAASSSNLAFTHVPILFLLPRTSTPAKANLCVAPVRVSHRKSRRDFRSFHRNPSFDLPFVLSLPKKILIASTSLYGRTESAGPRASLSPPRALCRRAALRAKLIGPRPATA